MLPDKPWKTHLVVRLLGGLCASLSLGFLIVMGYKSLLNDPSKADTDFFILLLGVFSFHGIGLVLVDVFLRLHDISWSEAFGFKAPRPGRAVFLALMVGILILPIAWELHDLSSKVLRLLNMPVDQQAVAKVVEATTSRWYLVCQGVLIVLIVPFVEEVIFRGIVYTSIKQSGFRKTALWGSSIFFGFMHMSAPHILPLTVLGIILVFLYETTQNLLAPIVAHSFFNAVGFATLLYQMHKSGPL
jgi:membrane protease YdiL (CAAX protease family)